LKVVNSLAFLEKLQFSFFANHLIPAIFLITMDLLKNLNSNRENNGDDEDDDDDEDDEDYVPEEDEGDEDEPSEKEDDDEETIEKGVKRKVSGDSRTESTKDSEETKEAKKKRADDLWADLCSTDSTENRYFYFVQVLKKCAFFVLNFGFFVLFTAQV